MKINEIGFVILQCLGILALIVSGVFYLIAFESLSDEEKQDIIIILQGSNY